MTRKSLLLQIALILMIALLAGCGGGTGSSSVPAGVNPAVPSIVQLLPVQQTVQTNSSISLRAKVLDGNGATIAGVPVVFTNLSLLGVLSSTTATTDSMGYAKVSLFSTDSGFATVQAEVNTGSGKVRDKKTVFFSIFDLFAPGGGAVGIPTLTLAVDNNNDGSFNDPPDFQLLDTTDQAMIRATVHDATGAPVLGDTITFGADSSEATFPDGAVKQTNSDGEAFVRLKVVPAELRDITVPLNVNAVSTNTGAFNVITLFLEPISVGNLSISANPATVDSGGTSTITAYVTTTAGVPVPDGTVVNFTINGGQAGVEPFVQTTAGVATATLTAPTLSPGSFSLSIKVTAAVGGKSATTTVVVIPPPAEPEPPAALSVGPANAAVQGLAPADVLTFTASGGTGPYVVTATCTPVGVSVCNDTTGTTGCGASDARIWNTSSTFKVTVGDEATGASVLGNCTLTVTDFVGDTATATLQIL